jgi:predicted HTH domain antitoxin
MPSRAVEVNLELPDDVSDQTREMAMNKAREAVVITLWEAEELSTREAAAELGLAYAEFLDLLASKGIPIVRGTFQTEPIEAAKRKLLEGSP